MSESGGGWKLYICRACGLIYDEKEGDVDSGLAPGTRFDDIPEDWECPLCGVKKSDFELFERPVVEANATSFKAQNKTTPGIVVIGGGLSGWAMVEAIRKKDTKTPITMITACAGNVYHKPELSVAIARQMNEENLVREQGIDAAKRLAINLLANTFVVGVSSKTKMVRTTRGSFYFTHLVLAQGAKSQLPAGIPPELCWRINHLYSWSGLEKKLQGKAKRVAIVGAGMVGCELAENLLLAGHKVTLIYRGDTPLNQLLPQIAAKRFANYLEQQGVSCMANASVTSTQLENTDEDNANTYQLTIDNGELLTVDQIVVATGLQADERIPTMAGLEYENGIVVDGKSLQTSQENIYALGDCISLDGQSCRFISPIGQQAKVIASQIEGVSPIAYQHEAPTIRLKVQACSLVIHGQPSKNSEWKKITEAKDSLTMVQWEDGEIVSKLELLKAS